MFVLAAVAIAACSNDEAHAANEEGSFGAAVEVSISAQPFDTAGGDANDSSGQCSGTFVPHSLDHITRGRGEVTAMSDGTGAGVLLEDIDDDGLVDIVLPNLAGDTSILWNDGDLGFVRDVLITGRFRQALTADINHDGHRDVLLTTGVGPPISLVATPDENRTFERREFRTSAVAYSAAIGDIGGDGRLEFVTGSYNAELTQNRDLRALTGNGTGAAIHSVDDGEVSTEFLAEQAQALVTLAADLNGDGRQDVIVGNDLGTPDMVWLGDDTTQGLTPSQPFDTTTLSTMSIDIIDFDNDGDPDVLATDMAPMPGEPKDPWLAVMPDIEAASIDDVQDPRNKLQLQGPDKRFEDVADDFGIEATGWSWSGVAGDLDNDGRLDLYVVNGMQATSIFPDLPNGSLIEANQAFRNTGEGLDPAPKWGLADTAGGRGMAQADLDGDGDLDIVVNNLGSTATLFENQLCQGSSIIVDPVWSTVQNSDALGASISVTSGAHTYTRQITSNRGYLSSPPTEAHIGLGDANETVDVVLRWPDGIITTIDDVEPGRRLIVERTAPPANVER